MAFLLSRMNKSYHRTFYVGGNTVSNLIPTPENCPLGTNNIELSLVKLGNLHASHSQIHSHSLVIFIWMGFLVK